MLDSLTIVMMLLAALLHASWRSLVKSVSDQLLILAGMGLVAAAIFACMVPFLPFPSMPVWIVIGGSACLHSGYKFALARAYHSFPSCWPWCFSASPLHPVQIGGIAAVSRGLIWLAIRSVRGGVDRRILMAALLAGLAVAGYVVVDSYGTWLAGDWLAYTAWLNITDGLLFASMVFAMRGRRLWPELYRARGRIFASSFLGILSISVLLWALSRGPVGAASALRESSVLFAAIIGIAVRREPATVQKFGAVACILAGLIVFTTMR
jgi:multidrug transporter EmrE-like cation transporter